jgi:hypothetical protein
LLFPQQRIITGAVWNARDNYRKHGFSSFLQNLNRWRAGANIDICEGFVNSESLLESACVQEFQDVTSSKNSVKNSHNSMMFLGQALSRAVEFQLGFLQACNGLSS